MLMVFTSEGLIIYDRLSINHLTYISSTNLEFSGMRVVRRLTRPLELTSSVPNFSGYQA